MLFSRGLTILHNLMQRYLLILLFRAICKILKSFIFIYSSLIIETKFFTVYLSWMLFIFVVLRLCIECHLFRQDPSKWLQFLDLAGLSFFLSLSKHNYITILSINAFAQIICRMPMSVSDFHTFHLRAPECHYWSCIPQVCDLTCATFM